VSEGWIGTLMDDYKKEPGGREKLKERNPKLINDLYVKFFRLSSHLIEKNGEGVLGFITNHGYLGNPTFRGMRWHLLNTFDRIWVLDLHGNAKKKEVTPEGKPDKNVFDIQQGVSIIIGVKRKNGRKGMAEVMHGDLWGDRESKYRALRENGKMQLACSIIQPQEPFWLLLDQKYERKEEYEGFVQLTELMSINSTGMKTHRDHFAIGFSKSDVEKRLADLKNLELSDEVVRSIYQLKDTRDWSLSKARSMARLSDEATIAPCAFRPFDSRWCIFGEVAMDWPRVEVMKNMLGQGNLAIATARSNKNPQLDHFLCVDKIMETKCAESSTQSALFPLYLYPDEQDLDQTRRVNFDRKLYKRLQELATHPDKGTPDEIAVFDYIYGVLHCPAYRETYAEFLKIDFPRIPWPASPDEFWNVSAKGTELRKLHLMDPATIGQTPFPFTGEGNNVVDKPRFEDGRVWINATQYFDSAPEVSWGFYIGGYQPAQKWLKDRKGRELGIEDVRHYQRILKILAETDRIMGTITMELAP